MSSSSGEGREATPSGVHIIIIRAESTGYDARCGEDQRSNCVMVREPSEASTSSTRVFLAGADRHSLLWAHRWVFFNRRPYWIGLVGGLPMHRTISCAMKPRQGMVVPTGCVRKKNSSRAWTETPRIFAAYLSRVMSMSRKRRGLLRLGAANRDVIDARRCYGRRAFLR